MGCFDMVLAEVSPIDPLHGTVADLERKQVAILIPCYNEAKSISLVVAGFRRACPAADIYVYDNGSTDETSTFARAAGAIVRHEPNQGKGNVVRRMFADVSADVYVLVDGDGTYNAAVAPAFIDKLLKNFAQHRREGQLNEAEGVASACSHRCGDSSSVCRNFCSFFLFQPWRQR
jgi:glycosyltransferase involved in cell wall biosynthesis